MVNSSRCRPGVLSIADEMIEWRYALLVSPKMAPFRHADRRGKRPFYRVDRKSSVPGQNDAIDPLRTS